MDACAGARERLLHDAVEPIAIRLPAEDVLAMVAAQRDMVDTACDVKSGLSGHPCLSAPGVRFSMLASAVVRQPAFLA
jgi:hypothetical protein